MMCHLLPPSETLTGTCTAVQKAATSKPVLDRLTIHYIQHVDKKHLSIPELDIFYCTFERDELSIIYSFNRLPCAHTPRRALSWIRTLALAMSK